MSAEIVNLNKIRKKRKKDESLAKAAENRRKHGRTKAEKITALRTRDTAEGDLDGKRLDD